MQEFFQCVPSYTLQNMVMVIVYLAVGCVGVIRLYTHVLVTFAWFSRIAKLKLNNLDSYTFGLL